MNYQVETTSICSLTCGYCPNKDLQRKREFMSPEVWQTILHRYIVPYRHRNVFCPPTFIGHKDGEPLLDKNILHRLRDISHFAPDMKIDMYSHGLMLPKWQERGQDVFEFFASLPNRVRYLMSYHPHNHDGSVNDYTATERYMRDMMTHRKPANVELIMVAHVSTHNNAERLAEWKRSWDGFPVTVHANASLNPWTGRIEEPGTVEFHGCPYGDFGHWFFGVTGNIIACCMDLEEEIVIGNVMKDEPDAMFAACDAFYAEQRRIAAERTGLKYQVCSNCMGMGKRTDLVQIGAMA